MRNIVENKTYTGDIDYISNINISKVSIQNNKFVLYLYVGTYFLVIMSLYYDIQDINILIRTPFLYVATIFFIIGLFYLFKNKATLHGFTPIYIIIYKFFVIVRDNFLKKYNQKKYTVDIELEKL